MEIAFRMKFFPVVLWAWMLSSLRLSVMSCAGALSLSVLLQVQGAIPGGWLPQVTTKEGN